MTASNLDVLYHLTPMLAIIVAVLFNVATTHLRTQSQAATDGRRLRAGLCSELSILREVCEENLRTLESGGESLLSCRQMTALYRSNLGRLQLLKQYEVPPLVDAYGFVELIESFLGATCKPHGQAYRALSGETPIDDIRKKLVTGRERITRVLRALDHEEAGVRQAIRSVALEGDPTGAAAPVIAVPSS